MAVKSMARKKSKVGSESERGDQSRIWLYLFLLTLQYGAQPLLSKRFTGKEVIVTSSVLVCEWAKVLCALILMLHEGSLGRVHKEWTFIGSLTASALPAAIYALQNSLLQKQTLQQVGALVLLIIAALLLSIGEHSGHGSKVDREQAFLMGIIPVIVASVLSGVASSLCQWASQVKKRSSYLMTIEMSAIGSLCLLASTLKSPDGEAIRQRGFFSGWTISTLIPIFTNAVGGILVGLVTTQAGGVRKGFVIVSALMVTALLQFIFDGIPPSSYVLFALPLVVTSIVVYQKYQFQAKAKTS